MVLVNVKGIDEGLTRTIKPKALKLQTRSFGRELVKLVIIPAERGCGGVASPWPPLKEGGMP